MARYLIKKENKLFNDSIKELINVDKCAHDCETFSDIPGISGLYPFHGARAFAHIFATKDDEFYFNFNEGGLPSSFKQRLTPIFKNSEKIIYYVNALFDNSILAIEGIKNTARIVDAPSMARIEYNRHGKDEYSEESFLSMKYLAQYYGVQLKNDEVKKYIQDNELYAAEKCKFTDKKIPLYNKVPIDIMFNYGCDDARTTFDLCSKIIKCINYKDNLYAGHRLDGKMIDVAKNEISLISHVLDARIEGLKIWPEYINKAIEHEKIVSGTLKMELDIETGGINVNSTSQVGEYLERAGIEVPRNAPTEVMTKRAQAWREKLEVIKNNPRLKTKEKQIADAKKKIRNYSLGNYNCDEKTLEILSGQYDKPELKKITDYKKSQKKINTYYSNYLLFADENNIVHANLRPETTKTGRFSCKEPNLQNLHKETFNGGEDEYLIRKSFIANSPDELLLFGDYSQQEMIVMLDQAGEMSVINKLLSGEFSDFYLATAAVIKDKTGKDITRKQAKAIALGLAYGQGDALLAKNLGCSLAEAKEIKRAFFSALPALKALDKYLKSQVKYHGKIHNPFGRVTYIPKGKEYVALNAFVQGMSADITKTAIVNICERFKREEIKSKFALTIHDEIVFRAKENELEKITPIIAEEMSGAYKHKHIALKVDFELSKRNKYGVSAWGEKVDFSV